MKTSIKPVAVQHFTESGAPCISLDDALQLVTRAASSKAAYESAVNAFKSAPVDWAHHTKLRAAYVAEYRKSGATVEAADKSWQRLCSACGYKAPKSTSKAAAAKRALRAKQPKQEKQAKPEPVSPVSGKVTAKGFLAVELTPVEQNLVKWFPEKKFAMIESLISAELAK
jgi:hypothetical protein